MRKFLEREIVPATVVVAFAVLVGFVAPRIFPFVGAVENRLGDLRVALLSAPEPQHPDIVVVTITEETLAGLPYRSPVDRAFLAGLLQSLEAADVRAIGLDILFDQPTEPAKDERLRSVLMGLAEPVVVAWAGRDDQLTERQAAYLDAYTAGIAHGLPNLMTDARDGVVRWIFPGGEREGKTTPGFAAAVATAIGASAPGEVVPLTYRIPPADGTPAFPTYPAQTVGLLPKAWLKGKIVLVGSDLPHGERHETPLSAARGATGGAMAGIVIYAHALAQIMAGRKAPGLGAGGEIVLLVVLAGIGLALAALDTSVTFKVGIGIAILLLHWVGGFTLFNVGGVLIPLIAPSLAFVVGGGVGSLYIGRRERQEKRFIRQAFGRYLSPDLVERLIADPSSLKLGGERRELTYIFTDVAGFTALTEKMEPEHLAPVLNDYLDGMCRIVVEYKGTIDRVAGDAVIAFFGAPVDQTNHPELAMGCAMAMDDFAEDYAARQRTKGVDFGLTRIGVHSGPAIIGNFGGDLFFDYTAHGDTVNTAARLESVNKHLGTRLCVSSATAGRCPDVRVRPIATLVMKGKSEGIEALEPLSPERVSSSSVAAYEAAFELLKRGDPGAHDAFAQLVEKHPDDTLAALHAGRLAAAKAA